MKRSNLATRKGLPRRDAQGTPRRRGRGVAASLAALLVGASLLPAVASAQAPGTNAAIVGYASGTGVHVDALEGFDVRLVNGDVAPASAAVSSPNGLTAALFNEMGRPVSPALPDARGYGRGAGLELGLGQDAEADGQLILAGTAEASSPPPTGLVTEEIGPVPASPLAWAAVARGQAQSLIPLSGDVCDTLGGDLSYGLGYVADAQLVNTGGEGDDGRMESPLVALDGTAPDRGVTQTESRMTLVPQRGPNGEVLGNNFGVMSEVRQTIAPIRLFDMFTIELLGEWVLQAVATGVPGGAYVHFGPGEVSPQTTVLRVLDEVGDVIGSLNLQDLLGATGLVIPIPELGLEVAVGEAPREIGGAAGSAPQVAPDGTSASAAIDVVRVRLLDMPDFDMSLLRLNVGHQEVAASVPAGGISCPVPVTKVANPPSVLVGNQFTTTITVHNRFECPMINVRLEDVLTTEGAARFRVVSTSPQADQVPPGDNLASGSVVWNSIGTIPANSATQVTVVLVAQGGAGAILDMATASGTLSCPGQGFGQAPVGGVGVTDLAVAGVGQLRVPVGAVAPDVLPRTGPVLAMTSAAGLALLAMAGAGLAIRRRMDGAL